MKRTLVITVLALALSPAALAQDKEKKPADQTKQPETKSQPVDKKAAPPGQTDQNKMDQNKMGQHSQVEQELMQIERDLAKASIGHDTAMLERMEADDYTFTTPEGSVITKAEDIAGLKSGDFKAESHDLTDMKVRVYGDTAIVTGLNTMKASYKGQDLSGAYRFTDVFVRRDGRWQIVAAHASRVAQR
jgi:ketosteroid isomerase-like protein